MNIIYLYNNSHKNNYQCMLSDIIMMMSMFTRIFFILHKLITFYEIVWAFTRERKEGCHSHFSSFLFGVSLFNNFWVPFNGFKSPKRPIKAFDEWLFPCRALWFCGFSQGKDVKFYFKIFHFEPSSL